MLKKLGVVLATFFFVLWLFQGQTSAQSAANLQADIYQLRMQVNQLQLQVSQMNRQGNSPSSGNNSPSNVPRQSELSEHQMLERLAILAIEAKDRLSALEKRVSSLEKRKQ
jgi:hypothetical protein